MRGIGRAVWAGVAAAVLGLSGCAAPLPIAQPSLPRSEQYTKAPLRAGDGSAFVTSYSTALQKSLAAGGKGLEELQDGPMLDRTRAELLIAKAEKNTLGTVGFDSVIAAGPPASAYPLWFVAFASSKDKKSGTQAMLVTRSSAAGPWRVQQGLFIDAKRVPSLAADGDGRVAGGSSAFRKAHGQAELRIKDYLSGADKKGLDDFDMSGAGFTGFRDYVEKYAGDKESFDKVSAQCQPYADEKFGERSLRTEGGAAAFGEMRCTLSLEVPKDYNMTLPSGVAAVTRGSKKGNHVDIEVSIPFLFETTAGKAKLTSSDWFVLSGKQSSTK